MWPKSAAAKRLPGDFRATSGRLPGRVASAVTKVVVAGVLNTSPVRVGPASRTNFLMRSCALEGRGQSSAPIARLPAPLGAQVLIPIDLQRGAGNWSVASTFRPPFVHLRYSARRRRTGLAGATSARRARRATFQDGKTLLVMHADGSHLRSVNLAVPGGDFIASEHG